MPQNSVNEMAAKFTAAYVELKDRKDLERLILIVKPMILSARSDGIADKELLEILNGLGFREKFYPAKLKELRKRLQVEGEEQDTSGDDERLVIPAEMDSETEAVLATEEHGK